MQISHSLEELSRQPQPSSVTVGSFDGIHRAHQELLRRVRERARRQGSRSVAVTFAPHPVAVLAPGKAPQLLTPLPNKLELLRQSGIDLLLILPFTLEFSRWSPAQFVEQVLVHALRTETVFVGENFHFGHRQAGNPRILRQLGTKFGFRTEILEKMVLRGHVVSSSQIRMLLEQGNVPLANRLLGYPFYLRGPIQTGLGIGTAHTVPTLNLDAGTSLVPQRGVYISMARLGSVEASTGTFVPRTKLISSVTNVGHRPTFGERKLGVETHLLEAWEDREASTLEVRFLYRLREERKFESAEQLKAQILRDVFRAQTYFQRLRTARISIAT